MEKRLADLEVGERIKFGRYAVDGEEPHDIVWIKVHRDNTFMTEHIEDFRAFDAKEPTSPDEYRRGYGNNDYSNANIRQFLNSADESWFAEQHEHDAAPSAEATHDNTPYEYHRGFLNLFTAGEYEAIEYSDVETVIPRVGLITMEQKVFLPSRANIYGDENNGFMEGQFWDYFNIYGESRRATPTDEAIDNTTLTGYTVNHGNNWYYWLRSARCGNSCGVYCVNEGGYYSGCDACQGVVGLRPALKLNPNILISGEDSNGYPILNLPEVKEVEFSSEEFLNILNI